MRRANHVRRLAQPVGIWNGHRIRRAGIGQGFYLDLRSLHVLRHINEHRAGASGRCEAKGFGNDAGSLRASPHEVVVLRDRDAQSVGVNLLKGICADQRRGHLARDADERDAVQFGIGNGGKHVGGTGAGGCEAHLRFSGHASHALGHKPRSLLVPGENVADARIARERVIERETSAAWNARDGFDALPFEQGDDKVRTCCLHLLSLGWRRCPQTGNKKPAGLHRRGFVKLVTNPYRASRVTTTTDRTDVGIAGLGM